MKGLWLQSLLLADSTIRLATPLVFCALAKLLSERAGGVNIALEGKMLGGAFAAASAAAVSGSAWVGLIAGIGFSCVLAVLHGFAAITHRGEQVVSGLAINIFVAGLGPTLADAWFGQAGRIPLSSGSARFAPLERPSVASIAGVPVLGPIYAEVVSGHNLLTYLAVAAVPTIAWVVVKTRFGLRLRAVGESQEAVDTAGVSVEAVRYGALLGAGVLCGLAGACLSIAQDAGFIRDMTAGKGFLALAALVFGKWLVVPAVLACLLFASADASQVRL